MPRRSLWNRRQFLQSAGALTAISGLPGVGYAAVYPSAPRYAYVGSAKDEGSIHVYAVDDRGWSLIQTVQSAQPAAFAMHPAAKVLYVANQTALCEGLPRGSVEAFRIDPGSGTLARCSHQPLSLSATMPTDLAVSLDARHLVAAAHGGGAYNLLPLGPDGGLERVAVIMKEIGCGPHPLHQQAAHPHTVLFAPGGNTLVSSDTGTDRLHSFRLDHGHFERTRQLSLTAGAGPSHMVFHPFGHLLYVICQLQSSITSFAYEASEGRIGEALWTGPLPVSDTASLAMHPSGRFLYTSGDEVFSWRINRSTGALRRLSALQGGYPAAHRLTMAADGQSLYALHESSGEIWQARIYHGCGRLGPSRIVATVTQPRCLLFQPQENRS